MTLSMGSMRRRPRPSVSLPTANGLGRASPTRGWRSLSSRSSPDLPASPQGPAPPGGGSVNEQRDHSTDDRSDQSRRADRSLRPLEQIPEESTYKRAD